MNDKGRLGALRFVDKRGDSRAVRGATSLSLRDERLAARVRAVEAKRLQQVELHNGAIKASRLGLGTASLHHVFSSRERQNLLACAWDHGITYFDTAPLYGHGLAECELGKFARGRRAKSIVVTKFGIWPNPIYSASILFYYVRMAAAKLPGVPPLHLPKRDFDARALVRSVEQSLRRLGIDCIDVLLLHEPSVRDLTEPAALAHALATLESAGKIRSFGISATADSLIGVHRACPALLKFVQAWWRPGQSLPAALAAINKAPDASFGHFRANGGQSMATRQGRQSLIARALVENPRGVVLFSTRSQSHLRQTVADFAELSQ